MTDQKPNFAEYLKLENMMAKLTPLEALGACMNIASMICGSLGITEEQFIALVRTTFAETAAGVRKGQSWIEASRGIDPKVKH